MTHNFLALVVSIFLLLSGCRGSDDTVSYGCVIDLGSKGSRISVFQWPTNAKIPYTQVSFGGSSSSPWYYKINPGIATLTDPTMAGLYIKPLLDYAASKLSDAEQQVAPMFIKGTDRLRQLNATTADIMLVTMYHYVSANYKFYIKPNFVSIIPGLLEGGYMWVSINYLMGNFDSGKESDTVGALDMGSGSTQIAFLAKKGTFLPFDYYYRFTYLDITYTPYVHSFTGYGYAAAQNTLNQELAVVVIDSSRGVVKNPCMLAGYNASFYMGSELIQLEGTGSWALCSTLTYNFLNKSVPCAYGSCSFDGAFQPPLRGDFMAVSNYYDVVTFLGLPADATPEQIATNGVKFCAMTWSQAQQKYPDVDIEDLSSFCFGANYLSTLLAQGYGFQQPVHTAKSYNGYPITWALGAMIYELQNRW